VQTVQHDRHEVRVICGDETPFRSGPGPKTRKKYLHIACTNLLTCYFLGDRDLASFKGFIYSDLHGTVVVHDRYQNYDSDVLRFLTDTAIPPTNQAERDLRPAKTQQRSPPAPLGENHPRSVRHPGLCLHRRQARTPDLHRHPRRPRRKPLDTAHPRHRMNCARIPLHNAIHQ
jgi:hypothetical protein